MILFSDKTKGLQLSKKKTQTFESNDFLFPCIELEWPGRKKGKIP